MASKGIVILSNACSGSSLLHGCLAAHPGVVATFEDQEPRLGASLVYFGKQARAAAEQGKVWATKLVLEKLLDEPAWPPAWQLDQWSWTEDDVLALARRHKLVWNERILSGYVDSIRRRQKPAPDPKVARAFHARCIRLRDRLREAGALVAEVRYTDLVSTPRPTLERLAQSLGLDPAGVSAMVETGPSSVVPPHYRRDGFGAA